MVDRHAILYRGPSIERATSVSVCTDRETLAALEGGDKAGLGDRSSGSGPKAFLAFFEGRPENAEMVGVSSDPALIAEFCRRQLASSVLQPGGDAVADLKTDAERRALEMVLAEVGGPKLVVEPRIVLRDRNSPLEVQATTDPGIVERLAPMIREAGPTRGAGSWTTTPEIVLHGADGKREAATTDPSVVLAVMEELREPYGLSQWGQLYADAKRRRDAIREKAENAAREKAAREAAKVPAVVVARYNRHGRKEIARTSYKPDIAKIIDIIESAPEAPRHLKPLARVGRLGKDAYPDVSVTVHGGAMYGGPVLAKAESLPAVLACLRELAIATMEDGERNRLCDDHAEHVERAIAIREKYVEEHGPIEPPKPRPKPEPEPEPWRLAFLRGPDREQARPFLSCDDGRMVSGIVEAIEHVTESPTAGPALTTPKPVQGAGPGAPVNRSAFVGARESPAVARERQARRERHWRRKRRVEWQHHRTGAAQPGDRVFLVIDCEGEPLFVTEDGAVADIAKAAALAADDDDNRIVPDDSKTMQWRRVGEREGDR